MYIYILEYPLFVHNEFHVKNHFRIVFYQTKLTFLFSKYLPFNPSIIWDSNVSYCIIICDLTPFLGIFQEYRGVKIQLNTLNYKQNMLRNITHEKTSIK